jgi:Uma2 family endonuclease
LAAHAQPIHIVAGFGPLIVVEILLPGDKPAHVEHKRELYFACGTLLMIVVDSRKRTVETSEHTGTTAHFDQDDILTSDAIRDLFRKADNTA